MKVITTYMANDGALFETEEECRQYEEKNIKSFYEVYKVDVLFFDDEGNQLSGTFDYLMNNCYYIYIHSKEDFNKLVKINNGGYCYELPECEGLWVYNFGTDEFEDYEEKIKEYTKEIKISENINYQINSHFFFKN